MAVILLVLLIAACCYAASLLRWPMGPCRKCSGKGTNPGSNRKRWGRCRKCKGARQVKRLGATAVHRFFWSIAGTALQEKRKEQVKQAEEEAGYPES